MIVERKLAENLGNIFSEYRQAGTPRRAFAKSARAAIQEAHSIGVTPLYSVQQMVRPLFGKGAPNAPAIGDHPAFAHLEGTDNTELCAVTTLFLDIANSTRLGLILGPMDTFRVKNAIICMATEIVNAFDGHVHRIMGDAVMAYFGDPGYTPESGAIDALNCAAFLQYFFRGAVLPHFTGAGIEDPVGIRIGIDHGPMDQVLWASYGYPGMNEVTATSFFVDSASKLQSQAPRNQIMLGQSLRTLLDLPSELLSHKKVTDEGRSVIERYLLPNYTGRDGRPINYEKFQLDWEPYLRLSALGYADAPVLYPNDTVPVPFTIEGWLADHELGPGLQPYLPCSAALRKGQHIRFEVGVHSPMLRPAFVTFRVENHGAEAYASGGDDNGNHSTRVKVTAGARSPAAVHYEHAQYRGLHYMLVEVEFEGGIKRSRRFGVFVE